MRARHPRSLHEFRFYVALFQGLNLVARIDSGAEFFKSASRVLAGSLRSASGAD